MVKITAMRGYSGSGKSTIAKTLGGSVVSRDSIRAMLTGRSDKFVGDKDFENTVTKVQYEAVRSLVLNGHDVVIDDTNLNGAYLRRWRDSAACWGADFEVRDVRTDVDKCVERDSRRENGVGEKVILGQAKRFPMRKWPVVEALPPLNTHIPGDQSAITVDIDGTLAHMMGRSPYDTSLYHTDVVDEDVATLVDHMHAAAGVRVILLSGRSEEYRAETLAWLIQHEVPYDYLFMRKSGDTRHDGIVKSELWDEHISGKFDVLFHLDDRDRVVDALRTKGVKVLQVERGDF